MLPAPQPSVARHQSSSLAIWPPHASTAVALVALKWIVTVVVLSPLGKPVTGACTYESTDVIVPLTRVSTLPRACLPAGALLSAGIGNVVAVEKTQPDTPEHGSLPAGSVPPRDGSRFQVVM